MEKQGDICSKVDQTTKFRYTTANRLIQSVLNGSSLTKNSMHTCMDPHMTQSIQRPQVLLSEFIGHKLVKCNNLLELDLRNNKITNIDGLASLKYLKRLNLSFNFIRKIEGLETLQRLRWLSFYHNEITEANGLDRCISLEFLSLGENRIQSIDENVGPHLQHLRHLRDLNLKGNPCMKVDISDQTNILDFLPSLVYFNDFKISKPKIDDDNYVYMPHNSTYYNVLSALDENRKPYSNQIQFELIQLYHQPDRTFIRKEELVGIDNIDCESNVSEIVTSLRPVLESIWTDHLATTWKLRMKLIQCIACYQKYLIDVEQDHLLLLLPDSSKVDEVHVNGLIEKEISLGEKLSTKWNDTLTEVSRIKSSMRNLQTSVYETMQMAVEKCFGSDPLLLTRKNMMSDILNKHLKGLLDKEDMQISSTEKALQDLTNNSHRRHRARYLEIARKYSLT